MPLLAVAVKSLLAVHAALEREAAGLTKRVVALAGRTPAARRLATVPGVGAITALAFVATIDDPGRFARSRSVGAHLGLTPRRYQSGEIDRGGRISKCGDGLMRALLFEAATVLLTRVRRGSTLKAWGMAVAKRRGLWRARVAVARKLAVILHRMLVDGSEFRWSAEAA
jgi:transposase